jgi:D-xylose transport system ATP-binding protein
MEPPPLLAIRSLTKDFPGVRALEDVTLEVRPGEIHALCGENGAGKSTLIRVLAGVWPHGSYTGEVRLRGLSVAFRGVRDAQQAGITVIHQELALVPQMSVADNLFLGREPMRHGVLDRRRLHADAAAQLAALGLDVDTHTLVGELGVGARQLVEIAKALLRRADILVLDEPTAALTDSETNTLHRILQSLRAQGVTMVYISHKLDEVFRVADRVTVLRDGRAIGTWDVRDLTPDELISHMVGRELSALFPHSRPDVRTPEPPLLEVRDWSVLRPHGRPLLDRITFDVRAGEILGVAGLMGAGRTELLMSLVGAWPQRATGSLLLAGRPVHVGSPRDAVRHGIALLTEDRKRYGLVMEMDVAENLTLAALRSLSPTGVTDRRAQLLRAAEQVRALDIRTPTLHTRVQTLSGGNQQKTVLGKWLLTRPLVLLLDEPTRGIDVAAKAEMHGLMDRLAGEGAAIVMVSSELPEILGMSDRVLVLHEGRVAGRFEDMRGVTQADVMACATGRAGAAAGAAS